MALKFVTNAKKKVSMTRKAQISNLMVKHTIFLGFVYSFGYFIPTLKLFQKYNDDADYSFLAKFAFRSLSYDLIFTIIFSWALMERNMISSRPIREILTPVFLALVSVVLIELITMLAGSPVALQVEDTSIAFVQSQNFFMILMSRFCYCFVNVASKMFQMKEQAV